MQIKMTTKGIMSALQRAVAAGRGAEAAPGVPARVLSDLIDGTASLRRDHDESLVIVYPLALDETAMLGELAGQFVAEQEPDAVH